MRRKDKLVTDTKVLHEVINKAEVARLGLVDGTHPYVIPLSFGFDGEHLYFHSAHEGRKIDILCDNNRVCLEFEVNTAIVKGSESPCSWSVRYLSVVGEGRAELVTDPAEKSHGLNQIIRHYDPARPARPFTEREMSAVAVFRVVFDVIAGKLSGERPEWLST